VINKDKILDILKTELKLHPLRVHNIYLYGSHCYGVANENSDYDFIIVANNNVENVEHNVIVDGVEYNFHIQTPDYFQERLDWNDPKTIECLLWSKEHPILENKLFEIKIIKSKYRHAVSHISSNSWVKARKKLELEKQIYIGQKSLYHSFRIPMYATQIIEHGKIIDWECANDIWYDVMNITDWKTIKDKYKKQHNKVISEFRKVCPK
jgi:predicted nucleotidyltransferase